jgi:hypothetical protein
MTTTEFLAEVDGHLAPGGVFAVNLAAGLDEPFPRAIYRTLASRFATVYAFPVPGLANTVLFATHRPALGVDELAVRAAALDRRAAAAGTPFNPPLAELAREREAMDFNQDAVPLLSDRYAPVDRLINLGERRLPRAP